MALLGLIALVTGCVQPEPGEGRVAEPAADDGDDPESLGDLPQPDDEEEDEDTLGEQALYGDETQDLALTFDADARAVLDAQTTGGGEDVPGTLTWQGESWEVGVHLRGGSRTFQGMDKKPSFKIDLREFVAEQDFHGVRRITLDNMVDDPSMLVEHAAYALYGQMGLAAPRHGYARLTVDGEPYGLYGVLETPDEQFVDRHWDGDEGTLYEGHLDLWPGNERSFEVLESSQETARPIEVYALVEALDAATPETWLATLQARFDADALFDLWAVELATGDLGAYLTRTDNYLLYWDGSEDRWTMGAWGTGQAFSAQLDVVGLYVARLYQTCYGAPDCMAALRPHLGDVADAWEAMGLAEHVAQVAERIAEDCAADPRSPWGEEGCTTGRDALVQFLRERPAEIRERLGE